MKETLRAKYSDLMLEVGKRNAAVLMDENFRGCGLRSTCLAGYCRTPRVLGKMGETVGRKGIDILWACV